MFTPSAHSSQRSGQRQSSSMACQPNAAHAQLVVAKMSPPVSTASVRELANTAAVQASISGTPTTGRSSRARRGR